MGTSKLGKPRRPYYGWVVVGAMLVIGTVILGTRYSFGVFFHSIETEFQLDRGATSAVFSAYMLLGAFMTLPWGWALDRYGPRAASIAMGLLSILSLVLTSLVTSYWQIFLTYSLLLALGTSGAYSIQATVISRWFVRKRGLAMGIGGTGSGLGTLVMSPVSAALILGFGWRPSYLIMAGIVLVFVIGAAFFLRRDPTAVGQPMDGVAGGPTGEPGSAPKPPAGFTLRESMRMGSFWYLWFAYFMSAVCIYLVTAHIVRHSEDTGMGATVGAGVLSVIGAASIVGRIVSGRISDTLGRKAVGIASGFLGAAAMLLIIWTSEAWGFYVFAAAFGLAWGGTAIMIPAAVGDVFGTRHLGAVMGTISIAFAVGAAVGPVLGGYVFDLSGGYTPAFLAGAAAMGLVAILMARLKKG